MKWKISYFSDRVQQAIREWPIKMRARYLRLLDLIENNGPDIGPPHTKSLGRELFEIRVKSQEGIGRAFFCYVVQNEIVILHAFIKKTQKTPKKELNIARKRLKEVIENG